MVIYIFSGQGHFDTCKKKTATTDGGCLLGLASANFESVVCYLVPGQYKETCALIDESMYLLMYG